MATIHGAPKPKGKLFRDLGMDSVTLSANGSASDYYLTIRGVISFLSITWREDAFQLAELVS